VLSYLVKQDYKKAVSRAEILDLYKNYYNDETFIKIIENNDPYLDAGLLNPMQCNNTNSLEISVYENVTDMVVISRLD
ncbi:N-acetyl-gamma-glutamyl-phosphate reductase, partial [Aliarcobacter butzleri]